MVWVVYFFISVLFITLVVFLFWIFQTYSNSGAKCSLQNERLLVFERANLHYYAVNISFENGLKPTSLWDNLSSRKTCYCDRPSCGEL